MAKSRFRVLSEEEFNRLTPDEKLAYLSGAFKAAVKSGDPAPNRRTLGSASGLASKHKPINK